MNVIIGSIPILSNEISNIKKGEPIPMHQFSDLVTQTFESSNFVAELNSIFETHFRLKMNSQLYGSRDLS